jgi:hypothetical protein
MDAHQFPETSRTFTEVLIESAALIDEWIRDRQQHPLAQGVQH